MLLKLPKYVIRRVFSPFFEDRRRRYREMLQSKSKNLVVPDRLEFTGINLLSHHGLVAGVYPLKTITHQTAIVTLDPFAISYHLYADYCGMVDIFGYNNLHSHQGLSV